MADISIVKLSEGLGFGSGKIAVRPRLEAHDDAISEQILATVDALIESPEILTPVGVDDDGLQIEDDGCGDGRGVGIVWEGREVKKRSLDRSKVFGGGATMIVAAEIGNGSSSSLEELFDTTIDRLDEKKVPFGAHTDDHAEGANCGCGAIDRAPEIIKNALVFKNDILSSIEAVTGQPSASNLPLIEAFKNFENYAATHQNEEYNGSIIMGMIVDSGKIVKQLIGPHLEARIVLNTIPNFTVNQRRVREISDEHAQVFAVDEWRLKLLSEKMYDTDVSRARAYYGMLIYTMATAGTLTVGDLSVYSTIPR
ncbi:hypothetical protein BH10PAT3_BH10PAT3_5640 [soil metagenome]